MDGSKRPSRRVRRSSPEHPSTCGRMAGKTLRGGRRFHSLSATATGCGAVDGFPRWSARSRAGRIVFRLDARASAPAYGTGTKSESPSASKPPGVCLRSPQSSAKFVIEASSWAIVRSVVQRGILCWPPCFFAKFIQCLKIPGITSRTTGGSSTPAARCRS